MSFCTLTFPATLPQIRGRIWKANIWVTKTSINFAQLIVNLTSVGRPRKIPNPSTEWRHFLTLFRLGWGGGLFEPPPSGEIVITPTPKELWRSNFLTFPKIYVGTFWYNYHVHVINRVAMATSFWHIGFGKFKKWWFFCFKIAFLHL